MTPALASSQCDYNRERWAVLTQISILVGIVWVSARWATMPDNQALPPSDWDFYVTQLRTVCGWHLETLQKHAHEWRGRPLTIPEYP